MSARSKRILESVATSVLVVCAIAMTGMAAASRFERPADPSQPTVVRDWEDYATGEKRIGPASAAVTIVEFSDFQCPFCVEFSHALERVRARHPNDVSVVFRNFPIARLHPFATAAAGAAECAAAAGKFPAYHDYLFQNPDSIGAENWTKIARQVGIVDTIAFRGCLTAESTMLQLRADSLAAVALGVTGTPTVLVNQRRFQGAPTEAALDSLIEKEARSRRKGK